MRMLFGQGDGATTMSAKGEINKGTTGLEYNYYRSNTGSIRQLVLDDTGIHANATEYLDNRQVRNIIVTTAQPNASMGQVGDVIMKMEA